MFPTGGFLKGRSELWLRTMSAGVLCVLALGTAWSGGWPLALFWGLAGAIAASEWCDLTLPDDKAASTSLGMLSAFLVFVAALVAWGEWFWLGIVAGLIASFACGYGATRTVRGATQLVIAFAVGSVLAMTPVAVRHAPDYGLPVLLWMFAVVWTTDIAAYFTGKTFGGPKLWPRVSPGKTWSGFAGGTLFGALAGVLVLGASYDWEISVMLVLASVLASVLGQGGDLAESALKRHAGVKDSGQIIPGHGGVLDRLDGFWAVAALVAVALIAGAF